MDAQLPRIPGAVHSSRIGSSRSRGALAARLAALGLVRQKEYLVTGTRKQFWQEGFCKAVIQVGRRLEMSLLI